MRNRNGDLVRDPAWRQQEAPDEYDEPAEDSHLEDYGSEFEDGFDMNPIEQGLWDDDPSPYSGDWSEM